ncbi:short-chain dehydrogenase [Sulfitobacter alexandrii]|uniref:Short-chain dehydrogenase n=1 Tax=Sulfitobacter alexandrii TaxID=1917485 RepID=A0A1J0WHZ8_9RHOB|nr:short-chain dehydrogenase/reductase [Sulfitobacter alexandrii]APE43925.1 short-chain dehydrogenase [Sulfitobacter alexandrii]
MDLELKGRHVLVTGASKGIGLETARAFAAEGARVTLVSRSRDALSAAREALVADSGAVVDCHAADLSDDAARAALFDDLPDVDILVNNAGAIKSGPLSERTMDDWRVGFDLKVWGYIHLCMLYAPRMRARGAGTIINIIGMGGRAVRPSYIIGAAGNAALIGFTNALGAETPQDGVRVFGINPSATRTDRMTDRLRAAARDRFGDADRWEELLDPDRFPFGRPAHAREVAALAVLLASPKVHYLSGTVVDMDGGGQWAG